MKLPSAPILIRSNLAVRYAGRARAIDNLKNAPPMAENAAAADRHCLSQSENIKTTRAEKIHGLSMVSIRTTRYWVCML